jgi:Ca2+/H+ antiporter, TMEM165/GDT1 family
MKKRGINRGVMFFLFFIVAVPLFGLLVMSLWNAILPQVIDGVKPITFWQSLGILLLSKILFGGFGGGRHSRQHGRQKWIEMKQKFAGMNPEEREKFKSEWKNRCGTRWGRYEKTEEPRTISPE